MHHMYSYLYSYLGKGQKRLNDVEKQDGFSYCFMVHVNANLLI